MSTEAKTVQPQGLRKNGMHIQGKMGKVNSLETDTQSSGKQWHAPRKAFRPGSGLKSYEKRVQERTATAEMKAKEKEMKDEKEEERQVSHVDKQSSRSLLTLWNRDECKPSRTSGPQKKNGNDMRRWPRRCTRSVLRD